MREGMMIDYKFVAEEEANALRLEEQYRWAIERCISKYGSDFKPIDVEYEMNHEPWNDDLEW